MAGLTKIEEYLIDLGISYEEIAPSTWLIEDAGKGLPRMVVSLAEPIVLIRADVMKAPEQNKEDFFAELLKLNDEDLLHGAYALDGDEVVIVDTLEYATMDKAEFEASIDAVGFALTEHYPLLSRFMKN
jgi:hypothetical protein